MDRPNDWADSDAAADATLMNYLRFGFATLVVVWVSQLYYKKKANEAKGAAAAAIESNDDANEGSEEEEEEDLFSDQDYPIKDNYGFTDGAFKMVIIIFLYVEI